MPTPDLSEFADFAATIAAEARDIGTEKKKEKTILIPSGYG